MENINLVSPWVDYAKKLKALFSRDPDITVKYIDEEKKVQLLVNGMDKSDALTKVMPEEVTFGNVSLKIEVVPANRELSSKDLMHIIFKDNPHYVGARELDPHGLGNPYTYVMFKPEVVQYWGDNMGDPNGNVFTLAQDIAKDVFRDLKGVFFTTCNEKEWGPLTNF